ncbi:MAG: hypothetical protein LVS60_19630 [Nodosilinea sp. LVE1205-7]|jgi:hypothetical protein
MIEQGLAIVVGLGSFALYGAAFFFPEIHRKHDFFWSGVGLFYALVLWVNAGHSRPTELLGHCASISLVGWWGWQTLTLRRRRTPLALQTPFTEDSWPGFRHEMAELGKAFLRQTALGRWLLRSSGTATPAPQSDSQKPLRASALKDVEYEFLDDLATVEPSSPHAGVALPSVPPSRSRLGPTTSTQPQTDTSILPLPKLLEWVRDLRQILVTPKPKRPVIVIPPGRPSLQRPPPILPRPSLLRLGLSWVPTLQ